MRSRSICQVVGCDRGAAAKGFCGKHYTRMRRHGDPEIVLKNRSKQKLDLGDRICEIPGCGRISYVYRLCQTHYKRKSIGQPDFDREIKIPGGGYVDEYGYHLVACPKEFSNMSKSDGMVAEHRLVMAQYLNRSLRPFPEETVHHINGDRLDNDITNLQLRIGVHGAGQAHQCLDCGSLNISSIPL